MNEVLWVGRYLLRTKVGNRRTSFGWEPKALHTLRGPIKRRLTMKARSKMATRSAKPRARRTITVKGAKPAGSLRRLPAVQPRAAEVPVPLGRAGTAVRDGIVGSLTTLTRIEGDIVMLVRSAVSSTLGATGTVASELVVVVRDVVAGALQATDEVGTGLVASTKSIAKGVVLGVHEVGGDVATAASETVRTVIKHAAAVGADVGLVARRAVDGIVEAAAETGENAGRVAKTAVEGAIKAAGEISTHTVRTVADVLAGVVRGVKVVVGATSPQRPVTHPMKAAKRSGATMRKTAKAPAKKTSKRAKKGG